jgi:hypothetical protein
VIAAIQDGHLTTVGVRIGKAMAFAITTSFTDQQPTSGASAVANIFDDKDERGFTVGP